MKKILYRLIISLLLVVLLLTIYLSTIGVKTEKFNDLIILKIKETQPDLSLKINKVSIKLNPFNLAINAKTLGANLIHKDKLIELENIKSQISLRSLIKNQFALTEIMISTKSIPLKNLIGLINTIKNDTRLLIAEQLIKSGYINVDLKFYFNEIGEINKNFEINGIVNDAKFSLLKKDITKLNFIFQISDKSFNFKDLTLSLNKKAISIPNLKIQKKNNEFFLSGNLNNKALNFKESEINDFIKNEFLKKNLKKITFSSDTNFAFDIDQKFKIKNLDIESIIDIKNLELNNFFVKNYFFPEMKNNIIFEKQKIKISYTKNKIDINGTGNVFLQDNLDVIGYKIQKNKDKYTFEVNLNIDDNPFIIDLINYEKSKKTSLELKIKGSADKKDITFDQIIFFENKNILSIKNLKLLKNYKIKDIENIKLDFQDKANQKNKLELKKYNKDYIISGDSFNADELITVLLKSKKKNKNIFLKKNFNLKIDIKKVFLDQNNIIDNLEGSILFGDNEITELYLESEFPDKQKIKFTIKDNNGAKITTLFSNEAKPIVDRYKFVKGFSEGKLDFYSISKNDKSKATLKIYDFKLKELPALTKILTLASLQGIADLLSGEGIRFNEFEMNFINEKDLMTINEIYAIGPAISILMDGYIEKDNLISLRGTLFPATTINKTIGSIPLLGNILVGKKIGEGVFGVSFKIKGPPKDLETTVNPIKTLTPRFITRTLEKIKKN